MVRGKPETSGPRRQETQIQRRGDRQVKVQDTRLPDRGLCHIVTSDREGQYKIDGMFNHNVFRQSIG